MVEIGSVIRAQVFRIEPYGLYLQCGKETVVVLATEVSWTEKGALHERVRIGDAFDVYVLRYNYRDKVAVGSIKRTHPEQNPYRRLSRCESGTVFQGQIERIFDKDVTVALPNGAYGSLPKCQFATEVRRGDSVRVVISSLEVEDGVLWLDLVREPAQPPNGPVKADAIGVTS